MEILEQLRKLRAAELQIVQLRDEVAVSEKSSSAAPLSSPGADVKINA
jgi:hypothetical protein